MFVISKVHYLATALYIQKREHNIVDTHVTSVMYLVRPTL